DFWVHANLRAVLTRKGDHDGVIAVSRKILELDPNNSSAYSELGRALAAKQNFDAAATAYRKAIDLGDHVPPTFCALGKALLHEPTDRAGLEIAALRKAVEACPQVAAAHSSLASALRAKGEHDAAVAAFRKAIELDPKSSSTYSGLGGTLLAKGDLEGA